MDILLLAIIVGVLIVLVVGLALFFLLRRPSSEQADEPTASGQKKPAPPKSEAPSRTPQTNGGNSSAPPKPTSKPVSKPDSASSSSPSPISSSSSAPEPILVDDYTETGNKIRILIVDDNQGTIENVTRLIYFEDDMEVIGQAFTGRQGIEMAIETRPHIILMDINMPDMDGISATREVASQAPFSQVVMMSVQSDIQYIQQAMAAGAREFQPKPFTADELINCIRQVYDASLPIYAELARASTQPTPVVAESDSSGPDMVGGAPVIVVYSPKGGTGVSALATNLALSLQQTQGNIILMDGDLEFGDLFVHLNLSAKRTIGDVVRDEVDADLVKQVLSEHKSGLKVLLAPSRPEMAEVIDPGLITDIIRILRQEARAVVIDTGHMLVDQTLAMIESATQLLAVTTPELPAIKNLQLFLDLVQALELVSPDQISVVVNRANVPGGIPTQQIRTVLKVGEVYTVPDDPKLHAALVRGTLIVQEDANAPSTQATMKLSEAIWKKLSQPTPVS